MSRLNDLINELCPDGVEYIRLNTICNIYDGTHQTPNYTENGVKFISVENINNIYATEKYISEDDYNKYKIKPQINDIFMTRIGNIGTCSVVEKNISVAYYVSLALLRPNTEVLNSKYLKYYIESKYGRKELYKRTLVNAVPIKINLVDIGKIMIKLPPLEVQREIVRILGNFTELIEKLNQEITLRKKQYSYYRNKLLDFGDDVELKTLGEIGRVSMCKRIMKNQTNSESGVPFYKIGTFGKTANAYISSDLFNEYKQKYSYPKKSDVLISASGTIGRTVIFDGKPAYFQDSNIVWIDNDEKIVLNKYLYYFYQTNPWKISEGGTIARLYNDDLAKIKIPVPPIEEQERIVKILDRFDTLCNDLTSGLPAEINARQKQYEYYRDKLLQFKIKSS
ncbi:MAG: restriction endonuclease subunit S [Ruminococcus sp.]|nr:restriction endonuclease subunit S [Ruminococcus sp.]